MEKGSLIKGVLKFTLSFPASQSYLIKIKINLSYSKSSNKSLNKSIDEDVNYLNEMDPNSRGKIQLKITYEKKSSNLAITMWVIFLEEFNFL